jgi:beta-barrel assembly-enhancing protease
MRATAGWLVTLMAAGALLRPVRCEAQDKPFTFTSIDLKLLEEADFIDAKLEKDGLVYSDDGLTRYLTTVGMAVIGDQPVPEHVTWRFRALRDSVPNAFALPNGSIYVHVGLLALLENEDQLASVLAHEATHVLARHGYLSYRSYRKKSLASTILGSAATGSSGATGVVASVIAGATQAILANTIAGYSRELEADADREGLERMGAAGFDISQMAASFRLLQTTSDLELETVFYNDHPKLAERIDSVTKLAHAVVSAPPAEETASERARRYTIAVEHSARDSVQQAIDARRYRSAAAFARRLVDRNPESTDMRYLLAEAFRALGPRTPLPSAQELEPSGRRKASSNQFRLTAAEDEKQLLLLPEGRAAWSDNQRESETQYQKALALDATNFKAYRGLGLLYEKAGRGQDAVAAFKKYLELALDPPDRARIQRHIDSIEKSTTNPG